MSPKSIIPIDSSMNVGTIAAENDDKFLFQCFIDHPAKSLVENMENSKAILLGSTGAGKTAILRKIESEKERSAFIELNNLSMGYVSNSDVVRFIHALDVPLDFFFQALWKHILVLEYIRIGFDVDSTKKSQSLWTRIQEYFIYDKAKTKAIQYLDKWSERFWVSFDEKIKEISQTLEMDVEANLGAEYRKFRADSGYSRKLGEEKKTHLQARLKKVVNADLLSDLARVIDALSEYSEGNKQRTVYILIDGLDDNWVDQSIKYRLIKSLIEGLKSLRKIRGVKVIASIRSDLLEKVISETRHDGFQSEKYEDFYARVIWKKDQIIELLDQRVNYLYRSKYSSEDVHLADVLPERVKKDKTTDLILERTLLRPRDAISFLNQCFVNAVDKIPLPERAVIRAEAVYSEDRRRALIEEWNSVFPCISAYLEQLNGKNESFRADEIWTTSFVESFGNSFLNISNCSDDPLYPTIEKAYGPQTGSDDRCLDEIVVAFLRSLHLCGAIGLNTQPHEPLHWFYVEQKEISPMAINRETKVKVHPMLHASLGIR